MCHLLQVVGVQRARWWTICNSVCYQRSVCVRWLVCATGRASRWSWTVRFVFVREEGLRDASLIQTVQVSGKYTYLFNLKIQSTVECYLHTVPGILKVWAIVIGQLCRAAVHCGWSSWSEWGECLGPCGVQSVQWSFRSPNNPTKHGDGRTCRGIYRKARRYEALSSLKLYSFYLSSYTLPHLYSLTFMVPIRPSLKVLVTYVRVTLHTNINNKWYIYS